MERDVFEKTDYGYILHQRNEDLIVAVITLIIFGSTALIIAIAAWHSGEVHQLDIWIEIALFIVCLLTALYCLRSDCRHMVLDEIGVYLHRPLAKTKFIPWEDIRDWGITHQFTRLGWVYCFYFSTTAIKQTRKGKNKKMPLTYKRTIYLSVKDADLYSLQQIGVIAFSRQQLVTNAKKYPPMFTSDLVH